jgi:hypothetical protein
MKNIFLAIVIILFASNLNAQYIDPPSGITTHLINGEYVVDGNYYTTIQQAITAAGTTGTVEIPSNYTGVDTYTNPNNITIFDYRMGNPSYLNGSITVPSNPTQPYQLTTKSYVDSSIATITGAKGVANGYAELDSNGFVLASEIPSMAIDETFVVTSTTAMTALAASVGDIAIVNTGNSATNATYILQALPASTLANWVLVVTPDTGVITVNGMSGNVTLGFPNITGTLGCGQLPALTGDITSVGCVTTAGGNTALLDGINTFTNLQHINFTSAQNATLLQMWEPNLPAGGINSTWFGVAASNYNYGALTFTYWGSGSTSNQIGLGLGGVNPLAIYGTGAISWDGGTQIPSSSNVCQTSGTNCPAGLVGSNYAALASSNTFTGATNTFVDVALTGGLLTMGGTTATTSQTVQLMTPGAQYMSVQFNNYGTNAAFLLYNQTGSALYGLPSGYFGLASGYDNIGFTVNGTMMGSFNTTGLSVAGTLSTSGAASAYSNTATTFMTSQYYFAGGGIPLSSMANNQGAYITWNSGALYGGTSFVNNEGAGTGGFAWQNGNNLSSPTTLMELLPNGTITSFVTGGGMAARSGGEGLTDDAGAVAGWNFSVASGSTFGWRYWNGVPGVGPQIAQLTAAGALAIASNLTVDGGEIVFPTGTITPMNGVISINVAQNGGECQTGTFTWTGLTGGQRIIATLQSPTSGGVSWYSTSTFYVSSANTAGYSFCTPFDTGQTAETFTWNLLAL